MLTRERIKAIISGRRWSELKGEVEGSLIECKGQPYSLADDRQKLNLAKAVVALANSDGGFVIFGVKTKTSDVHHGDEIIGLAPFEQSRFDTNKHRKVLKDWTYPELAGLDISWVAETERSTVGYGIIEVPNQDHGRRPFLLAKSLVDANRVGMLFGYVERHHDTNQPLDISTLHKRLQIGFDYERTISGQLEAILSRLEESKLRAEVRVDTKEALEIDSAPSKLTQLKPLKTYSLGTHDSASLDTMPCLLILDMSSSFRTSSALTLEKSSSIRRMLKGGTRDSTLVAAGLSSCVASVGDWKGSVTSLI